MSIITSDNIKIKVNKNIKKMFLLYEDIPE